MFRWVPKSEFYEIQSPFWMDSQKKAGGSRKRKRRAVPDFVQQVGVNFSRLTLKECDLVEAAAGSAPSEEAPSGDNNRLVRTLVAGEPFCAPFAASSSASLGTVQLVEGQQLELDGAAEPTLCSNPSDKTLVVYRAGRRVLVPPRTSFLLGPVALCRHLLFRRSRILRRSTFRWGFLRLHRHRPTLAQQVGPATEQVRLLCECTRSGTRARPSSCSASCPLGRCSARPACSACG